MKALIALSGLAGFVLFGVPVLLANKPHNPRVVRIETRAVHQVRWNDQDRCRFEAERSLTVPVSAGQDLRLSAGSGTLEVVGVAGLREIRAVGRACASHEEYLDDIRLTSDAEASAVVVETHYPEFSGMSWGNGRYASLDLRVEVPEGMAGEIRDGSGDASVSGMGALIIQDGSGGLVVDGLSGDLRVDDGSGELEISGVAGTVRVDDGSGEIHVWNVTGGVEIDDSSGEIFLEDIGGDVQIEDSSGEVEIQGVRGSVTLTDGSGEIDVRDVEKSVRVLGDGSGSISVDGVLGDFVVERDGGGSIRQSNVQGTVDIPRKRRER